MNFISTKGKTVDDLPKDEYVLVQYLEPFFGGFSVEFGIGYFDTDEGREGWKLLSNENTINVVAYAEFPKPIESSAAKLSQKEFFQKFGSYHPNFGNVGD